MPPRTEYIEAMKSTVERIPRQGFHLLTLDDIAWGVRRTVRAVTIDAIIRMTECPPDRTLMMVDYQAHFGRTDIVHDFLALGLPEYVLQYLIHEAKYIVKRQKGISVPAYEELLQLALTALQSKYSRDEIDIWMKTVGITRGVTDTR